MIKYSFIIPVYDRAKQLSNTLESFYMLYKGRDDYQVVIVEDKKNHDDKQMNNELAQVFSKYRGKGVPIKYLYPAINNNGPAPLMNAGVQASLFSEYVILTNAEIIHTGNVLSALDKVFDINPDVYVTVACANVDNLRINSNGILDYDFIKWFQHSEHRPAGYPFCGVMSTVNYLKTGFDDAFGKGVCFCDNDFLASLKKEKIETVMLDVPVVLHQKHRQAIVPNRKALWNINREQYNKKWGASL